MKRKEVHYVSFGIRFIVSKLNTINIHITKSQEKVWTRNWIKTKNIEKTLTCCDYFVFS